MSTPRTAATRRRTPAPPTPDGPPPLACAAAPPGPSLSPVGEGPGTPDPRTRAGQPPGAVVGEVLSAAPGIQVLAAAMSEAELDRHVRAIAGDLGLRRFHVYSSRRSDPGWPDLVFAGRWIMFRELKTQRGKVSEAQKEWLHALELAGGDVGVWRPGDLLNGTVAKELAACARAAWMGDRT